MAKKLLSILLITVILTNFIYIRPVFAIVGEDKASTALMDSNTANVSEFVNSEESSDVYNEGKTSTGRSMTIVDNNQSGIVLKMMSALINTIPLTIELVLTLLTQNGIDLDSYDTSRVTDTNGVSTGANEISFSVAKTVFNKIGMFDIDFFNLDSDTYQSGSDTITIPSSIKSMKENIAKWFYVLRLMSTAVALLVLIYVGIRMALSTISSDRAKYKKMLISWFESMMILFILQYIIVFMLLLGQTLENLAINLKEQVEASGTGYSFEQVILDKMANRMFLATDNSILMTTLQLWCMMIIHVRFFLLYMKRFFMTGFLILIAPLITITYPIDKIGDGQAQAFMGWFKELLISVTIQPLHAIIYLVFAYTAGAICERAPLLALIFLMLLTSVEGIVRSIFTMRNSIIVGGLKEQDPGRKKKG